MTPTDRSALKAALLAEFDRRHSWPGICALAERFNTSRQNVSKILLRERGKRYGKLKGNRGRRKDLGR
jgi:hypothetical protein